MLAGSCQVVSGFVNVYGGHVVSGGLLLLPPVVRLLVGQGLGGVYASVLGLVICTDSGSLSVRGGRCRSALACRLCRHVVAASGCTVYHVVPLVSRRSLLRTLLWWRPHFFPGDVVGCQVHACWVGYPWFVLDAAFVRCWRRSVVVLVVEL